MSAILTPSQTPPDAEETIIDGPGTLRWTNSLHALGKTFFTEQSAQGVPSPYWVAASSACAAMIGLPADWQSDEHLQALQVLSGNAQWKGMRPLSTVYSGHQFGVWAGQLGDGRALWLGEVASRDGPLELQLKGAGRTPYSRGADGRAVLRSSIREFLCSEAMAALGIPTTRALCVIGTDMRVRREQVETGAVVTRAAQSFLRFGHFEHFANTAPGTQDAPYAALRQLADFAIDHCYPQARSAPKPVLAMLEAISKRTAELMAGWQSVGFCHGVMNTDNMSILGLTIDYGPFGFLDRFDPNHICNHTDEQGRYAYSRQPNIGYWNLLALGQALLPLIEDTDAAIAAIDTYKAAFSAALQRRMGAKVGLATVQAGDQELVESLLSLMARGRADFTITFRRLSSFSTAEGSRNDQIRDLFIDREAFDAWAALYAGRLRSEGSVDAERLLKMNAANPKYVLRNHLAETAIERARQGDFGEVQRLHAILEKPFDEQPENAAYADFPPDWASHIEVSCSS